MPSVCQTPSAKGSHLPGTERREQGCWGAGEKGFQGAGEQGCQGAGIPGSRDSREQECPWSAGSDDEV